MSDEYDSCEEAQEVLLEPPEENLEYDPDIPDVPWKNDIQAIKNPILREMAIEEANKIIEEKRVLDERYKSGEIDIIDYQYEYFQVLGRKKIAAATRAALASEGITGDHLGGLSEDQGLLVAGDTKALDSKDKVEKIIREIGTDAAQDLADRMLEEGKISKETHESISRMVRIQELDEE